MHTWLSSRHLVLGVATALAAAGVALHAQSRENPAPGDPRVGLKPGFRDAGQAVLNIELVSTLPKPDGFFDPEEAGRHARAGSSRQRAGSRPGLAGWSRGRRATQAAGRSRPGLRQLGSRVSAATACSSATSTASTST